MASSLGDAATLFDRLLEAPAWNVLLVKATYRLGR